LAAGAGESGWTLTIVFEERVSRESFASHFPL
jgi:hypothetical protein